MTAENASLFDEFKKKVEMKTPHTHSVSEEKERQEELSLTSVGVLENTDGETASEGESEESSEEEGKKPVTNRNKNGIFINVKNALIGLGTIVALSVLVIITKEHYFPVPVLEKA